MADLPAANSPGGARVPGPRQYPGYPDTRQGQPACTFVYTWARNDEERRRELLAHLITDHGRPAWWSGYYLYELETEHEALVRNVDDTAPYGPQTVQVERLLQAIGRASIQDMWSMALHYQSCMRYDSGVVTLRNAGRASELAARLHNRVGEQDRSAEAVGEATRERADAVGITEQHLVTEVQGLLTTAAGVIVVADYLAVEFQQEALDPVGHYLGITFDLPTPQRSVVDDDPGVEVDLER